MSKITSNLTRAGQKVEPYQEGSFAPSQVFFISRSILIFTSTAIALGNTYLLTDIVVTSMADYHPAPGNCDDHDDIVAVMGNYIYPRHVNPAPEDDPAAHACNGVHLLCENREANNQCHPVPAGAPRGPGVPTTRNRTVCTACELQGLAMSMADRHHLLPPPPPAPGAPPGGPAVFFIPGHEMVFHNDEAANNHAMRHGVAAFNIQLGIHHIGRLCRLCENTEIVRYWERRTQGVRPQTEEKASNTCKCEAYLNKNLCYQDRCNGLLNARQKSGDNAAWPNAWLKWLFFDPADDRAKWATAEPTGAAARAAILAARGNPLPLVGAERNACRCGREIPKRGAQHRSRLHRSRPNTPIPVAMCTACDGVVIDVLHPRVSGWANFRRTRRNDPQAPPVLPPREQGSSLKLRRWVPQV